MNIKSILLCGSAHPTYNISIMIKEYLKWGIRPTYSKINYLRSLNEIKESDFIHVPSEFVKKLL